MSTHKKIIVAIIGTIVLALIGSATYFITTTCSPVPTSEPQLGSQGYRIWSGPTLQTFDHNNKRICVPDGWQAVSATQSGNGWAKFESGLTGVLIRPSAFASTTLQFQNSSYVVTVLYPGSESTPLSERYVRAVKNAFERTGAVFGDSSKNPQRTHTVLVTPGIEGATSANGSIAVYPDPGPNLSIFVQNVDSQRGEELFIHGVTHLYNRFRDDLMAYQKNQSPVPEEDWQELEAVWAETAFRTTDDGRSARIDYLYTVHTAVQTKNFALIHSPPFDDREAFNSIRPGVILKEDSTYLEVQYGHYILGPLALIATEGLLQKYGTRTDLERILLSIHTGKAKNFFDELEKVLPLKEVENSKAWMFDGKTIPYELVLQGNNYYSTK